MYGGTPGSDSATRIPLKEGNTHSVGIFLGELVEPIEPLVEAGHVVEFVSPDGKGCVIDEASYKLTNWGLSNSRMQHAKSFFETRLHELGIGALLSRLRHQCHTVKIEGPSLRDPEDDRAP